MCSSDLAVQPLAFAARLGLMLTAFNLLPVGQLDGGHMARALFGERVALWTGRITLAALAALGLFVWHGFLVWVLTAFVMGGGRSARDGEADVAVERGFLQDGRRLALGAAAFALVALIIVPMAGSGASLGGSGCPWR